MLLSFSYLLVVESHLWITCPAEANIYQILKTLDMTFFEPILAFF